jgi:predicted DCC family thiol-disulfide oxidoreductase YuxK
VVTVLIFDGECGFCSACVRWGYKNLRVMPKSVPFQLADLPGLGLTIEQVSAAVWLIDAGQHHRGHLAVAGLLAMQPSLGWRALAKAMRTPGFSAIFAVGYALVVRFRHRLPGATEACALPAKTASTERADRS